MGYLARTLLAKTAGLNWAITAGLVIWHVMPGPGPDLGLIILFAALAITGTMVASIRRTFRDDPVDTLLRALLASRAGGQPEPQLRSVPSAGQSEVPSQRDSAA